MVTITGQALVWIIVALLLIVLGVFIISNGVDVKDGALASLANVWRLG